LVFSGVAKGHHFYSLGKIYIYYQICKIITLCCNIGASNNGIASIFSGATHLLNNTVVDIAAFQKLKALVPHPVEVSSIVPLYYTFFSNVSILFFVK
jgi:hypothetical protein